MSWSGRSQSSGTVNGYLDLYTDAMGIGFESARSYGLSAGSIVFNGYKSETESESNFSAEIQFLLHIINLRK